MENIPQTKYSAIKDILEQENISDKLKTSVKVSIEQLAAALSRTDNYNLKECLGLSAAGLAKLTKKLFPEKPRTGIKVCTYLLDKYGKKFCPSCCLVLLKDNFFSNSRETTGVHCYCKACYYIKTNATKAAYNATRVAELSSRVPAWANRDLIKDIYNNCPTGYHVDHIIPLRGKLVSGLHVENNLQYLSAKDNILKSNSFIV